MKTVIFWAAILVSAFLLWQNVSAKPEQKTQEISYSRFLSEVSAGQVSKVVIAGRVVRAYDKQGAVVRVISPPSQDAMLATLQQQGVEVWFQDVADGSWPNWLLNLAPLVLLAALWFFMIRQLQKGTKLRSTSPSPEGSEPPPIQPSRFGS
jgi:cell division protease FtsH